MAYALLVFPLQVPPGFRATRRTQKNDRPLDCLNNPGSGYSAGGQHWPPERPILYDSFEEVREGGVHHYAMDIMCAEGTPVVSTTDGTVPRMWTYEGEVRPGAGVSEKGGHYVWVTDGAGYQHYYAHMSRLFVAPGDRVRAGQLIGFCSNQGHAGCSHVHYALKDPRGTRINQYEALKQLYDRGGWRGTPIGWPPRRVPWPVLALAGGAIVAAAGGYFWWRSRRRRL